MPWWLVGLLAAAQAIRLLAVISDSTPRELLDLVSREQAKKWLSAGRIADLSVVRSTDLEGLATTVDQSAGVIDMTYSSLATQVLGEICEAASVPHMVLGYVADTRNYEWTYYLSGRQEDLASALDAVVRYFGWNKVNLVTDGSLDVIQTGAILAASPDSRYTTIGFSLTDPESVERTVGQQMRRSGNRVNVFLTSPELTRAIITAQYDKKIGGAGFANLLLHHSALALTDLSIPSIATGSLIVTEEEVVGLKSMQALYQAILTRIATAYSGYTEKLQIKGILDQLHPEKYRNAPFVIENLQAGVLVPIGVIKNNVVTLTAPAVFLGNTTDIPRNARAPLYISGNFGVRNVATISPTAHYYYRGALLAVEQIAAMPGLLTNFQLELFNFTAGVTVWNYNFSYQNVYPNRDKLGLAVMAGTSSGVTIQLINLLKSFNFTGPIIGSSTTVDSLSSRKDFPTFARTVLADSFITNVYVQMFKRFGWTTCGLFVSNETWGLGFRAAFGALAEKHGIRIANDPILQVLPTPIPSIDTLRNYSANFLDFINTKARVLIIVVNNNAILTIDYLYELGLRAGELQIVANEWMSLGLVASNDTEVNRRRSELLRGVIQFAPAAFLGSIGAQMKADYTAKYAYQPPTYACFFYDSALALAYALDHAIQAGQDYTNSTILLKSLRGSRFVGCTGTVTFQSDTNDRAPMQYSILNAQFGSNDSYITNFTSVGVYDPTSTVVFRFDSDIIWCDGSTTIPEVLRKSSIGCPFEDKYDHDFPKGRNLLYGVCFGITLLTAVITALMWRLWWNRPLVKLTEPKEINLQDVVLMLGIAIELVQYISIGPDLGFFSSAVGTLLSSSTLDVQSFLSFKNGGFEIIWCAVFGVVVIWALMNIIVFCHLDYHLEWCPCCNFVGDISEIAIPFIGNWLFVPIIAVLMDVFQCVRGVSETPNSPNFQDSYLHEDCYLDCWQGVHVFYIVASALSLALYLPASVLLRPLWQELQEQLNVKTFPLYLLVKSVIEVLLISFNKAVKITNPIVHTCFYLTLFGAFLAFSLRFQCFGYKRTALWHILSLIAVIWTALLALIHQLSSDSSSVVLFALLISGWGLIVIAGVVYQIKRIPSLLYRKPGVDVSNLFRFAFKRATADIMFALKENFERVGHRNNVVVLPSAATTDRRPASVIEVMTTEAQQTSPRVRPAAKTDLV